MSTEQQYKEEIYKKAKEVKTEKELLKLIEEIKTFNHDYGTIVYGCMAAMTAAFQVINEGPQGGITGFQAGCLGHELIQKFMMTQPPYRIMDYNNMLYPQYSDKFEKVISSDTWNDLKEKAQKSLNENALSTHPSVIAHWQSIVNGNVPFGYSVKQEN